MIARRAFLIPVGAGWETRALIAGRVFANRSRLFYNRPTQWAGSGATMNLQNRLRTGVALSWLSAALLGAVPAAAQAPMSCGPANLGQHACQAENVCRCIYSAGGTMTREPVGYRWGC